MSTLPTMSGVTQRVPRGQGTLIIEGDAYERPLGSVKLGFELKSELLDLRTNEVRTRPIVDQVVTDLNGDIKVELFSFDAFIMAISHMAVPYENWTQPAMAAGTKTFTDVREGDRAVLTDNAGRRLYGVVMSKVEPAGAASIDARTGRVAFAADAAEVVITYTAAAITAADRKHFMRLFSKPLIRGRFSLTQDNAVGTNYEYVIPRVTLATNGTIGGVGNDGSQSSTEITMRILHDSTQEAGKERGWATAIGEPE